jgi:hypothetical protein
MAGRLVNDAKTGEEYLFNYKNDWNDLFCHQKGGFKA